MNLSANKKLSIKLATPAFFKNNVGLLFWLILLALFIAEGLVIKDSASIVLSSQKTPPLPVKSRGVRVNFKDYDAVVKRINNASSFVPSPDTGADPFTGRRGTNLPSAVDEQALASTTPQVPQNASSTVR